MSGVVDRVLETGKRLVCGMRGEAQRRSAVGTESRQTAGHDDRHHGDRHSESERRRTGYVVVVVVIQ